MGGAISQRGRLRLRPRPHVVNPGGSPLQGVPSTRRGQKIEEKGFSAAPIAPRKFFEYCLETFGKFVNINSIKSDFWGGVDRYISKISKNTHFWEKNYNAPVSQPRFWSYVTISHAGENILHKHF